MSLDVTSYNQKYNIFSNSKSSIDVQAAKDITSQILNADPAEATIDLSKADLSKFRKVDMGMDLYSQSTNAEKATQVAVRNSGVDLNLNQNFIANVQYLNSQAAVNALQTTKRVEGKIVLPATEDNEINMREVFSLPKSADVFSTQNLNKDKRGSNPFSYQKPANKKEKSENEPLSIFA